MNVKREYAIDQVVERYVDGKEATIIRDRDNEERAVILTDDAIYVIQAGERYNIANVTRTLSVSGSQAHSTVYTGADVAVKPAPLPKSPCYCDSAYHPQGC